MDAANDDNPSITSYLALKRLMCIAQRGDIQAQNLVYKISADVAARIDTSIEQLSIALIRLVNVRQDNNFAIIQRKLNFLENIKSQMNDVLNKDSGEVADTILRSIQIISEYSDPDYAFS